MKVARILRPANDPQRVSHHALVHRCACGSNRFNILWNGPGLFPSLCCHVCETDATDAFQRRG